MSQANRGSSLNEYPFGVRKGVELKQVGAGGLCVWVCGCVRKGRPLGNTGAH